MASSQLPLPQQHPFVTEFAMGKQLQALVKQGKRNTIEYEQLRQQYDTLRQMGSSNSSEHNGSFSSLSSAVKKMLRFNNSNNNNDEEEAALLMNRFSQFLNYHQTTALLDLNRVTPQFLLNGNEDLLSRATSLILINNYSASNAVKVATSASSSSSSSASSTPLSSSPSSASASEIADYEDAIFTCAAQNIKLLAHYLHTQYFLPKLLAAANQGNIVEQLYSEHLPYFNLLNQPHVMKYVFEEHFSYCIAKQQQQSSSLLSSSVSVDSSSSSFSPSKNSTTIPANTSLLAFTIAISYLEHGFQDAISALFMSKGNKKACMEFNAKPIKINDLLVMPEMIELFGTDAVFLLRCFMGPLNSLNLRNVTLHGFLMPHEDEFNEAFTSLLIMLIMSLGSKVKHLLGGINSNSSSSPYVAPTVDLKMEASVKALGKQIILTSNNNELLQQDQEEEAEDEENNNKQREEKAKEEEEEIKAIHKLIDRSYFVMSPWCTLWYKVVEYYHGKKYYQCLMLMFPLFEHCIRRIWVCTNNCAHRLLTAEKHSLYTTLDILLSTIPSSYITNNSTTTTNNSSKSVVNSCIDELGDAQLVNMIFDLLVWTNSPRVRDLMCHGSVIPESISAVIVDRAMVMFYNLLVKYDVERGQEEAEPQQQEQQQQQQYLQKLLAPEVQIAVRYLNSEYEPVFHPKNMFYRALSEAFGLLGKFDETITMIRQNKSVQAIIGNNSGGEDSISSTITNTLVERIKEFTSYFKQDPSFLKHKHDAKDWQIHSVLMQEKEIRKVLLLHTMATNCTLALSEVMQQVTELLTLIEAKKARDRHRQNLKSVHAIANAIFAMMEYHLVLTHVEYFDLVSSAADAGKSNGNSNPQPSNSSNGTRKNLAYDHSKAIASELSTVKAGKWQRLLEILVSFLFNLAQGEGITGFELKTVSKNEAERLYCSFKVVPTSQ